MKIIYHSKQENALVGSWFESVHLAIGISVKDGHGHDDLPTALVC